MGSPAVGHLVLLVSLLLCSSGRLRGASFYGDGFIHLQTEELSNRNYLHLRFRTASQSGLLFLASGGGDFLLLEIISGRLQVRVDLGSGERTLRSAGGLHLSDLAWHRVQLTHLLHNVSLTVDQHSHTSATLPAGGNPELSVRQGVFVGGTPGQQHPLVWSSPRFRGCMEDVVFNKHHLLASLRSEPGHRTVQRVSWGCSTQFWAWEDDPVSFSSSQSFLLLPPWQVSQEGELELQLRPSATAQDGTVLFSSALRGGFVAMEIRDARLVAMVRSNSGCSGTELQAGTRLHGNQSAWYAVRLRLAPHGVQLRVGQEVVEAALDVEGPVLRPTGPLYLGGRDEGGRAEASPAGAWGSSGGPQPGGSFRGCLRDVRVNGQRLGLPQASVTRDVSVGCGGRGQPPDTETSPDLLELLNAEADAEQPMGSGRGQGQMKSSSSFLSLEELEVEEGGGARLEPKHIQVNLDFRSMDLHPSQLMFRLEEQPVHGRLCLDPASPTPRTTGQEEEEEEEEEAVAGGEEEAAGQTFSMLDVWQGRVLYVHSGSEEPRDVLVFSAFSSSVRLQELSEVSRGKARMLHHLPVAVRPVNDAPQLSLPPGNLLALLERSRCQLTPDMLRVMDPDSRPEDLTFSCFAALSNQAGHLEHQDNPGRPISSFSWVDLKKGKVSFVHTGAPTSRLALRVSDGEKMSNTGVLRVMAVSLEHQLVNNTGLEVDQGGSVVITASHLAVQLNVAHQGVEIRYDVTEAPRYGQLQRLHSSGKWKAIGSFSQKLVEEEQLRYLNTHRALQAQRNATDRFTCNITVGTIATNTKEAVVVSIAIRWIQFKVTQSRMEVAGVQMSALTSEDLHAVSRGVKLQDSDVFFRLLVPPKKGLLIFKQEVLKMSSTFSQKNVSEGLVHYQLLTAHSEDTRDSFSFQVFSTQANSSSHDFRVSIKAEAAISVSVVNKGLSVPEGDSKVITMEMLFTHTAANRVVRYVVTTCPRHGRLRRIDVSNSTANDDNIGAFTNQDITAQRLLYVHDDSETQHDAFVFSVNVYRPQRSHKASARKDDQHTFNISVQLINDQRPVRVVHKVFQVARDGQRLLTADVLRYRDDDSDFDDGQLVYTRRGIPIGDLVSSNDTAHSLYQFTQQDLQQNKVLFIHRGVSFGRFVLFVTDGKHYVSTLLEVKAEDPYLQVDCNTGLWVERGGVTTLTSANLSVLTNLDVRTPGEVTYEVYIPPTHGVLLLTDPNHQEVTMPTGGVTTFTQQDLSAGLLVYRHDNSLQLSDGFNVTARVRERAGEEGRGTAGERGVTERGGREVHLDVGVVVRVYLESHQRPPTVLTHRPLVVEEGSTASVGRDLLEVTHEDSLASGIVFSVQRPPSLGSLLKTSGDQMEYNLLHHQHHQGDTQHPITSFSQEDLNRGWVSYRHEATGGTNDSLLLAATNGVTEVGPITVEIDVIPKLLPLQVLGMTLDEGSTKPLTPDVIRVTNHHFRGMNFLYEVIAAPQHGHLEHSRIPGMPISAFTQTELEREYIFYIHDGSDTLSDSFTITANQTESRKHSGRANVSITITPINDQTPTVIANKMLKVWVGSVTEVTEEELSAEDQDTGPEGLEFQVTPPSNGHLALRTAPSRSILTFTQMDIQSQQLLFIHRGALSGGFHFQVNDGVNFAPRQIFSTVARSRLLSLHRNQPLEVYPGSVTTVSKEVLQVVTDDDGDITRSHSAVFTVTTPPKLGCLVERLADKSIRPVSSFTQSMVNAGGILYDQNLPEAVGWSAEDAFLFTVSAPPASLPPHTFTILITAHSSPPPDYPRTSTSPPHHPPTVKTQLLGSTPDGRLSHPPTATPPPPHHHLNDLHDSNAGETQSANQIPSDEDSHAAKSQLRANTGALVEEGGKVVIDRYKLDASNLMGRVPEPCRHGHQVLYHVIALPRHGMLSIGGQNLSKEHLIFSQKSLETHGVEYVHDNSDTINDGFVFRAWVASSEKLSSSTPSCSLTSSSSSSPLPEPLSLSSFAMPPQRRSEDRVEVMERFSISVKPVNDQPPLLRTSAPGLQVVVGETITLGPENLQVDDQDTPPEELHYSVIRKPSNGYLTLGERPEVVASFTQYDVNHGRLHFVQQGEPSTGVFYFNVTDGYHRPLYKIFSLEVTKATISMVNNTGLSLVQSRTAVVLTTTQLAAQTNGRRPSNITYTVTTHPLHGRIAINDLEVVAFRHEDLRSGRVVYHMTKLSESEDSFKLSVSASSSPGVVYRELTEQVVSVTVRPLVFLREEVRVPSGVAVKLSKAMMDASELARVSRADPVFHVLSPPKHGRLVKVTYDLDHTSEVLTAFTFRDVVQGRVAIQETLSDDLPLLNGSTGTTPRGHAPATPRNDSFTFLVRAGQVQPAVGELHFTILPHHHMHHSGPKKDKTGVNKTTSSRQGRGRGREGGATTTHAKPSVPSDTHILSHRAHNRTLHNKTRAHHHHRGANHTQAAGEAGRSGGDVSREGGAGGKKHAPPPDSHPPVQRNPGLARGPPPNLHPVQMEVLPQPASDPLLLILPLLACLLLIVILVVLCRVVRHRREKRARIRLLQELAAVAMPMDSNPYLGRPEHSPAMPSVVVTPMVPLSCPSSPVVVQFPRRRSLAPSIMLSGRQEINVRAGGVGRMGDLEGHPSGVTSSPPSVGRLRVCQIPRSPAPSLKNNQYWV